MVVLEGEGLANDATALVLYRFAVVAVTTGTFSLGEAAGEFVLIVVGEIIYGLAVGWLSLRLRQWSHEPRVEITLSLMTPYLAFWVPAHLGGSGVLATVACGLYVSWNGPLLIPSATRLQGIFFWDLIVYLIEGLVFLVTGLQARTLIEQTQRFAIHDLMIATAWTTLIVIVARFIWVFPATYLPRWLSPSLAKRDPSPPWQTTFFLAFTGMRGVDSLAVALAIPYALDSGAPFPHRDLILFVTFGVIIVTLVGQGLMLPAVMRWLGLTDIGKAEREEEIEAELVARVAALDEVDKRFEKFIAERGLPDDAAEHIRTRNRSRKQLLPKNLTDGLEQTRRTAGVKKELIDAEREYIFQLAARRQDHRRGAPAHRIRAGSRRGEPRQPRAGRRRVDLAMTASAGTDRFYASLPVFRDFTQVVDEANFRRCRTAGWSASPTWCNRPRRSPRTATRR